MKPNTLRVLAGIGAVAVAVVLLLLLKDDGDDKSDSGTSTAKTETVAPAGESTGQIQAEKKPAIPTIVIKNGEPVGGIADISVNEGDQVRFKVESDVSDEVHMHGYDIAKDVAAGGSVTFAFPATIEGIFEAELESRGEQILELTVNP